MSKKAGGAQARNDSTPQYAVTSESSGVSGANANDLQQIQNLLFGAQAREIDTNLQQLEHRLNERMDQMSLAFDGQIEKLGVLMSGQIDKERNERTLGQEVVVQSVDELRSRLTGALSDMVERQQQDRREIAEELQASSAKLATQMALQNEQLSSRLQKAHSELEQSKLSKQSMAKLLNEMAAGI